MPVIIFFQQQGRTLSQIEQFWAYMLEGDKIVEEKDFEFSVLVNIHKTYIKRTKSFIRDSP